MNRMTTPADPEGCVWGFECTWEYYSAWVVWGLCLTAAGQVLLVKVCPSKTFAGKPGPWLMIICLLGLIIIQWRYLIEACLYLPRADFAAGRLVNVGCILSTKGGKSSAHMRDCYMGEQTNCTVTVPCTACNPIKGMDKAAVWNWYVQQPCRSCASNEDAYDCRSLERDVSQCALTYEGDALAGTARFDTLSSVTSSPTDRSGHMPVEFWRVKKTMPCSSCCQTNRTQAWRRLLSQSLRNTTWAYGTTFNFSLKLPLVAADDDARGWRTRDVEWLYSLVTRQLELDASWFVLDTPYPLNMSDNTTFVADVANTRVGVSLPLNVNSHWYFN